MCDGYIHHHIVVYDNDVRANRIYYIYCELERLTQEWMVLNKLLKVMKTGV